MTKIQSERQKSSENVNHEVKKCVRMLKLPGVKMIVMTSISATYVMTSNSLSQQIFVIIS